MTDWIHCNSCFVQPSPERRFFLTSCGHVYCATCADKYSNGTCYVCGNRCTSIPLSSKMKPEVEAYFLDPTEVSKKHSQELQKVIEFQRGHRKRLLSKTKERLDRAQVLHQQFKQACGRIQELERANKGLIQENGFLKQQLKLCGKDVTQLLGGPQQMFGISATNTQSNRPLRPVNSPVETIFTSPLSQYQASIVSPASLNGNAAGMLPRLTIRTPPSRGKMGFIPGSNTSSGCNENYLTPMSVGTPSRTMKPSTPSSQASRPQLSQSNIYHTSLSMPSLGQIRLPGVNRLTGSLSSLRKKATVSPYSPHGTPT